MSLALFPFKLETGGNVYPLTKAKWETGVVLKGIGIHIFIFLTKCFWVNNWLGILWVYGMCCGKAKRKFSLKHCPINKAGGRRGGQPSAPGGRGVSVGVGAAVLLFYPLTVYTVYGQVSSGCSSIENAWGVEAVNCLLKLPVTFISIQLIRLGLRTSLWGRKRNYLDFANSIVTCAVHYP